MDERAEWAENRIDSQVQPLDGPEWEELLAERVGLPSTSSYGDGDASDACDGVAGDVDGGGQSSQAQVLCEMLQDIELFHDADSSAYATLPVKEHLETFPIRSETMRNFLRYYFYQTFRKPPPAQAIVDVLGLLEARAQHEGPEVPVFVRVGLHEETIYLDLADGEWRAVAISPSGWEVVERPPVRFRRPRGLLELPCPLHGGTLMTLRDLLGVDGGDWLLIISWLLMAYRPRGPYPILSMHGEQGTGKSTRTRMLRRLVDPNKSLLRAEPRGSRDLMIAARNGWVLAFDNLSSLRPWLSDGLCRLSTGGGFSTRELYSDSEELIIDATRPMIINGIERLGSRGDLLERSLLVEFSPIGDRQRKEEDELWRKFEADQPRLLGALLDVLVRALACLREVKLESLPRMADFARWGVAVERALGEPEGSFFNAYSANTHSGHELALESDSFAMSLLQHISRFRGEWSGRPSDLLTLLSNAADDSTRRSPEWPRSASSLTGKIRRLLPHLRSHGIEITSSRSGAARVIHITSRPANASLPSLSSLDRHKSNSPQS